MHHSRHRATHWLPAVAVCIFLGQSAPAQEPSTPPEPPPTPAQDEEGAPDLLDFDRLEGSVRLGFIAFSEGFESKPQFAASLLARAPSPWLSRDLLGLESDAVGAFLEMTFSRIDRDLDPAFDHTDGTTFFVGLGLDYTIVRDGSWMAAAQLGLQYGFFGNVDDTHDGVALLMGLMGNYQISQGIWATLSPQAAIADAGDRLYFFHFGVLFAF
jgi:hypothetical protein